MDIVQVRLGMDTVGMGMDTVQVEFGAGHWADGIRAGHCAGEVWDGHCAGEDGAALALGSGSWLCISGLQTWNNGILEYQVWFSHREGGESSSLVVLAGEGEMSSPPSPCPNPCK